MTNILWLGRILPAPVNAGDRLYTLGLVKSLSAAGSDIVVLGLVDPDSPNPDLAALPADVDWCKVPGRPNSLAASLFSLLPLVSKRFATRDYRRKLREQLDKQKPQVVVLDHYSMVWALKAVRGRSVTIVAVAHNFETRLLWQIFENFRGNGLKKIALYLNAVKTRRAEQQLVRAADLMITITPADEAEFARLGARKLITITPGYDGPRLPPSLPRAERRVLLFGSYRWVAKQMNLRAFLQAADAPFFERGIGLDVVGEMPPELRAELQPGLRATRLMGFVDDPSSVFRSARIGVVPEVTGGGFKLKTLDYIFAGLPVAGLLAALEGVPPEVKRHMLVADDLDGPCPCDL